MDALWVQAWYKHNFLLNLQAREIFSGNEYYQGNPREGLKKLISGGESAAPSIGCGGPGGQAYKLNKSGESKLK